METFSALLALCEGNPKVTGGFPSQRPVTWSFDVYLICAWANGWANNRDASDLRRHCAHYERPSIIDIENLSRYPSWERLILLTSSCGAVLVTSHERCRSPKQRNLDCLFEISFWLTAMETLNFYIIAPPPPPPPLFWEEDQWPVDSPWKERSRRKLFPCRDVLVDIFTSTYPSGLTIPWICYEKSFSEFYLSIWNQLVFNQRLQLFVQSPQLYLLIFAWRN